MDSHPPPSCPTLLQDSAALKAPPAASSQSITDEVEFNLVRPGKTIQVKIEPSDSPPLSQDLPSSSTYFNLERPRAPPAASITTPEVIDLTHSPPAGHLNLDRPLHKARSSGLTSVTPSPAINLDRPLRKAKSAQSYQGLPPSAANPLFGPGKGTDPMRKDWADEKLSFPRSKVGDPFSHIFGD